MKNIKQIRNYLWKELNKEESDEENIGEVRAEVHWDKIFDE